METGKTMISENSYHTDDKILRLRLFMLNGICIASVPIPTEAAEAKMMETMLYKFLRQEPESKTMKDFVEIGIMMGRKI